MVAAQAKNYRCATLMFWSGGRLWNSFYEPISISIIIILNIPEKISEVAEDDAGTHRPVWKELLQRKKKPAVFLL